MWSDEAYITTDGELMSLDISSIGYRTMLLNVWCYAIASYIFIIKNIKSQLQPSIFTILAAMLYNPYLFGDAML